MATRNTEARRFPGYNRLILQGNIARDVEVRDSSSGNSVITTSLGMTRPMGDDSQFINLVIFSANNERIARFFQEHVHKGTGLIVEGKLDINVRENEDGTKSYFTQLIVDNAFYSNTGTSKPADGEAEEEEAPAPARTPARTASRAPTTPAPATRPGGRPVAKSTGKQVNTDDLPF